MRQLWGVSKSGECWTLNIRAPQIHRLDIQGEAVFFHPSSAAPEALMVDLGPIAYLQIPPYGAIIIKVAPVCLPAMIMVKSVSRIGISFLILFGFWILLSGRLDAMHLGLGLVCSLLVALSSHDLLITSYEGIFSRLGVFIRFIPYLGWLVWQIIIANINVARIVLNPRMPLSPGIIKLSSYLKSDMALTTLANSITLTPGTMTVDVVGIDFYVHCLAVEDEEKLLDEERKFERHVERLFGLKGGHDKK